MARPGVKAWLLIALACACERATPTPPTRRDAPAKPDPIRDARAEFELLPSAYAAGTHKLYSRSDFFAAGDVMKSLDEGDFIGRLRTLFGPLDTDELVVRHKASGLVITAYAGNSGPAYGGGLPHDDGDVARIEARRAADPVIAGKPFPSSDARAVHDFVVHMDDADAPDGAPAVVRRLEALVEAVPPADWETTKYYEDSQTVVHLGAAHGASFEAELEPAAAMVFLLGGADAVADRDLADDWLPSVHAMFYFAAHRDELAALRPRVLAVYQRVARAAARETRRDTRAAMSDTLHAVAPALGL